LNALTLNRVRRLRTGSYLGGKLLLGRQRRRRRIIKSRVSFTVLIFEVLLYHTCADVVPRMLRAFERRQPVNVTHRCVRACVKQSGHHDVMPGIARGVERRGARVRRRVVGAGPRSE
jgi:hypothetical protein